MQCPICKKHTMLETELLPELSGMACTALVRDAVVASRELAEESRASVSFGF